MKRNRLLAMSIKIQDRKMVNILGMLENEFPSSIFNIKNEDVKTRDRIFIVNNTLLAMVLTLVQ